VIPEPQASKPETRNRKPETVSSIFLVHIIPHLTHHGQIMGHFIAENDTGDTVGKGVTGHGFNIQGFMMEMLAGDTEGYIEHDYLTWLAEVWGPHLRAMR
jgi:hypothetical protein